MKKQSTPLTPEQQAQAEAAYHILEPFMACFSIRQINHLLSEMFAAYAVSEGFQEEERFTQRDKAGVYISLSHMLNELVLAIPDGETRPIPKKAA